VNVSASARQGQRVDKAIAEIRQFHKLGREVLGKTTAPTFKKGYGQDLVDRKRRRLGHEHETTIRKARQFALLYNPADLEQLIRTIQKYERSGDVRRPVFGVTAVMALVTAGPDDVRKKDKAQLRKVQELAIRGAWSTAQLEAYIRARKPRLRQGGRPPVLPDDLPGLRVRIKSACHTWQRLVKAIHLHRAQRGLGSDLREVLDKSDKAVGQILESLTSDD
jgi:hypothetical protein